MSRPVKIQWLTEPETHDYPAAVSFLTLIYKGKRAHRFAEALKAAPVIQFKAKDIFRASGLPLLGAGNSHVAKDCKKIRAGAKVSPVLLVRDSANGKVIIADGYHRVCAVYTFDEDAIIPCKIVWGNTPRQEAEHVGETVVTCGQVVEQRTHHQITGEPMKFLTLADWTGMVETELFAQTMERE